ncbi:TIGR02679 family protein [Virgibacillus pantothenticus]|uniref:TIGR02679 family protein n=1 Tax=Virgibacillus pantothenticus TaxID=1473 RepID=UPI0009861455|nr:TIGR02679 family protein [Virgibacillus pantothenticus]
METEGLLKEATLFFKSEQAYDKLFKQFRKKYESLGRIGGTISVQLFSERELEVIASFYGTTKETLMKKGTIHVAQFASQLQETKYYGIELKQLLDYYFGEEIISKKQRKEIAQHRLESHLQQLATSYPLLFDWLLYVLSTPSDMRWVVRLAEKDVTYFDQLVGKLAKAREHLPTKPERLPMFSQRITADPHAFDINTDLGKLFIDVLAFYHPEWSKHEVPQTTESINELLRVHHIYRDDLLNFVTCSGLLAETMEDVLHPVWSAAVKMNTVQNVPLRELFVINRIFPAIGSHVWVVENSGVCSALLDELPNTPIVSTNGQFKLAAWIVLDLLAKEGCTIYYASDFDPEGLGMAERLLHRYPQHVRVWQMSIRAYKKSNPVKSIDEERLKKLERIEHPDLLTLAQEIKRTKKVGYQEALVKDMLHDIQQKLLRA